jgi:hypothetical protein
MKSNIAPNASGLARAVDPRYLQVAGAFAVGGAFTRVGSQKVFVPIPTVASVELPLTGGLSTAKSGKFSLDGSRVKFPPLPKNVLADLRKTQLLSLASATASIASRHVALNQPKGSLINVEVKGLKVEGGFSLKNAVLNIETEHAPGAMFPSIRLGDTGIFGMKLGKMEVKVELDLQAFNTFPTLQTFEHAWTNGDSRISRQVSNSFLRNSDGTLHRNAAGYTMGSIVKKITCDPSLQIEDNGYTIVWPPFGKVIIGEILMGPFVRRVVLVRLKHCDIEVGGGCGGGSNYP